MEKLWAEKSKNGSMPSYQMCMLLPQIRKNFEVDEEAVDEMITELDKGICRATLICANSIWFILFFCFRGKRIDHSRGLWEGLSPFSGSKITLHLHWKDWTIQSNRVQRKFCFEFFRIVSGRILSYNLTMIWHGLWHVAAFTVFNKKKSSNCTTLWVFTKWEMVHLHSLHWLTLVWMPGHCELTGNEREYELARLVTKCLVNWFSIAQMKDEGWRMFLMWHHQKQNKWY